MTTPKFLTAALLGAGFCFSTLGGIALAAHHEEGEKSVYEQREETMKSFGGAVKSISGMLKGTAPFDLEAATKGGAMIAEKSAMIPDLFPEGSNEGESEALPKIWEDWDGFVAAAKLLGERAEVLAAATDQASVGAAFGAMAQSCGGCHKEFRKEKE